MLNGLLGYRYVATQAPLATTIWDFWQMVWEQDSLTVVMLTRIVEASKMKAIRYWPSQVGETMATDRGLSITLLSEKLHPCQHICVRVLQLKFTVPGGGGTRQRNVTHLHYTEWPDYGLPSSTEGIRILVHLTDALTRSQLEDARRGDCAPAAGPPAQSSHNSSALPPIVVHCSAGIGRAGTFIAIHQTVKQIQGKIEHDGMGVTSTPDLTDVKSIMNIVLTMREQRRGMVQTKEQYSFIYRVARDALNDLLDNRGHDPVPNPLRQSWNSEGRAAAAFLENKSDERPESVFLRRTNMTVPLDHSLEPCNSADDVVFEDGPLGSDSDNDEKGW
mmetsp:Transcript_28022/g.78378  ORF Transcript_28022/g.78378 Transcript_28022/m.78378 type:complete len:332 (-) Transcript_28022:82-1077(-)